MGKSVTTYLIDGDPNGTKYAFISNKICQMYVIPRSNLWRNGHLVGWLFQPTFLYL